MDAVPVKPMEHGLDKWREVAQDVYTQHLSKPYTLNTCQEDWEYPVGVGTIPRPNHGIVHTLRTASYVSLVVKAYNYFHPKKPIPTEDIDKMRLALMFFIVGRENEGAWNNFPDDYFRYRLKSAQAFETYIKSKKELADQFTPDQLQFYTQAVRDPYIRERPEYIVIRFCHDLDLRRCYPEDKCSTKVQEGAVHFGYLAGPLSELAFDCIRATGDRVLGLSQYNGPVFIACSQSVDETTAKIDAVFKQKQDEILHIIQYIPTPGDFPIPRDLKEAVNDPESPWRLSPELFAQLKNPTKESAYKKAQVLPEHKEWEFIWKYFHNQKPIRYGIARIWAIHQRERVNAFESSIAVMDKQSEQLSPEYTGQEADQRRQVLDRWRKSSEIFSPVCTKEDDGRKITWKKSFVIPLWHGTKKGVCESICTSGMTFFGKTAIAGVKGMAFKNTDDGYIGSGIYFTNSARYAADMYSGGHVLLSWVSMREPFPVIGSPGQSDMAKLRGKGAFGSCNAHFAPVASTMPSEPYHIDYVPAMDNQKPIFDEYVVFQSAQTLPQFWIELEPDFPYLMTPNLDPRKVNDLIHQLMKILQHPHIVKDAKLQTIFNYQLGALLKCQPEEDLTPKQKELCQLLSTLLTLEGTIDPAVREQIGIDFGSIPKSPVPPSLLRNNSQSHQKAALAEIKKNWKIVSSFSAMLKDDEVLMNAAIRRNGNALEFASPRIRGLHDPVLAAVRKNGEALQFASEELKDDPVIAREAVLNSQDGDAMQYVSQRLKNDSEFVLAVVRKKWQAFRFASDSLRDDEDFTLNALKQACGDYTLSIINRTTLRQALSVLSERLRDDVEFFKKAKKKLGLITVDEVKGAFKFLGV